VIPRGHSTASGVVCEVGRLAAVLLVVSALAASGCARPAPPPVLAELPAYELVAADGSPFGSAELLGAPYVVSFFFTTCVTVCPRVMAGMRRVQDTTAAEGAPVALVSITVDPEHDDPAALRGYAIQVGADAGRWRLLTGTEERVRSVVVEAFMHPMGQRSQRPDGLFDIAHGARLLLVDGQGRLRGLYDPDEAGTDALLRALDALPGD
jgi:protein SCO1